MSIGILGEDKGWDLIKKRQQIFADHMMHSIDNNLNNERKELELSLKLILKERHLEYAKYKAFPKTDESLKDTLFFEFGKHICEATGCPMDIRLVIAACSGAFAFTKGVKWNKILREVV